MPYGAVWLSFWFPTRPSALQCFFPRDIFFGARHIFGKNARDIKKMPVTILGKNARDMPDFKSSKILY